MAEIYKEHHEESGSTYVPKTIAQILIHVSAINDFPRKVMILEFHIQALEEEMRRSSASKHPLYYSTHFLEDAIEILKHEIVRCKRRGKDPVVEDIMPVKRGFEECSGVKESKNINEKREWMSSTQLCTNNQHSLLHHKSSHQGKEASSSGGNFKHKVGAFMPSSSAAMKNKWFDPVSSQVVEPEVLEGKRKDPTVSKSRPQKKQRRCWSAELHKQFVDALQSLGGIELATPKQIREVMDVKGLTNNEVKSHLQKYRLYIRNFPSSTQQSNP